MIPFGDYLPDLPDFENPGATVATNVLPHQKSYLPWPSQSVYSSAIDARARGAILARDKDDNVYNYVGNATKLYRLVTTTQTDASLAPYTTGAEERWSFAQWGQTVIATNFADNPQVITLGGTTFANLTTALKARHVTVIRDFVVFGNTFDATDGNVPNRVRWSAFGDSTDYTVSAATQSDFQNIQSGGWVQGITGGEYGLVFQDAAVQRMTYVGSPVVFQFDEILPGIGTPAPGSIAQMGDMVFFLSQRGFGAIVGGSGIEWIGDNKIDRTFFADLDETYIYRMSSVVDPVEQRVYWAYPGAGNTGGTPNKLLAYDWSTGRWSSGEFSVEFLTVAATSGFTLDSLDTVSSSIDALTESLDSRTWAGGAATFAAYDTDHKLAFFTGTPMTGTVETSELQLFPKRRALLNAVRPLTDGGASTVSVISRNRQQDNTSEAGPFSVRASGRATMRVNARYHRVRVTASGDFTHVPGVELEGRAVGSFR